MAFRWRADDDPLIVVFVWILSPLIEGEGTLSNLDHLWQNILDLRMQAKINYNGIFLHFYKYILLLVKNLCEIRNCLHTKPFSPVLLVLRDFAINWTFFAWLIND